jgi:hypothetical protein
MTVGGSAKMKTIEDLGKFAELNLCRDCFLKYKELIEPKIKIWLSQPLSDWRQAERQITQIVMKTKGVFKDKMVWVISFDESEEEEVADYVDVKAFREIEKKWGIKRKIDYLHEKGIVGDSSFKLLHEARETRNKIHIDAGFSEEDYVLFSIASLITSQIMSAITFDWEEEIITNTKFNTEKVAEQWLKTHQAKS